MALDELIIDDYGISIKTIKYLPNLEYVNFHMVCPEENELKYLADLPKLKRLRFTSNTAIYESLENLPYIKGLEELEIRLGPNSTIDGIENQHDLIKLSVECPNINCDKLKDLKLEEFIIQGGKSSFSNIDKISEMRTLHSLEILCNINDENLKQIENTKFDYVTFLLIRLPDTSTIENSFPNASISTYDI